MSILDLGSISVLVTKSTANSLLNTKSISYAGCIAQVFLFVFFAAANITLLTVMAYDRYITICQPLDYDRVMNRDACVQMAASAWITAIVYSALHTGNIFRLPFYQLNVINQFFCEIPQLLKLACSDSHLSEVGILIFSACLILSCFALIIASYVHIFMIVLRILSEQGQGKVFFTCLPHLTVISLLFCTGIFAHLKPTSSSASRMDLVMAVLYSVVPPTMNPVIYSLTKKEIKAALRRLNVWTLFTKNNIFVFLS
ncbi:olfactory receptor 14I1-like [Gopherus evgoodei]|uniref:olfactory receptor 14I1-like n=1 Tax=Gopherus evgoodei TaxID=1825980 RepID=UPI0011CFA081|nr:olfactory receptor 14I1-like [Gopherus evgoodei]